MIIQQILGIIMMLGLMLSGLPQALQSIKNGHSIGINPGMLWLWAIGDLSGLIYIMRSTMDVYLIANYVINLLFIGIIMKYKYLPRQHKNV